MTGNKFTALLPLLLGATSCAPDPGIVTLPSGLEMSWDSMPHRLSQLEITSDLAAAGEETLTAQNDGGDFGPFDQPRARYDYVRAEHAGLSSYQDSIHFVIAPPAEPDSTTRFAASQEVVLDTNQLETNESVAIFLRGFRIETDLYDTPPAFQTDPEQPYDPSMGFTTSGFGISLSQPRKAGDKWKSTITVRNGLAAGDRPDMNAAITEALSWLRVDYLVVGGPSSVVVSTAETHYDLSYPTFGSQTESQVRAATSNPSPRAFIPWKPIHKLVRQARLWTCISQIALSSERSEVSALEHRVPRQSYAPAHPRPHPGWRRS